jgi:HEPN domain-containing protein
VVIENLFHRLNQINIVKKAAAVEWRDFKKQSDLDIAACRLLYNAGDYGNAAYHLQQAVEKHTKAILLAGNLLTGGKTHLPLSKFIDDLLPAFYTLERMVESQWDSRRRRRTRKQKVTVFSSKPSYNTKVSRKGQIIQKRPMEKLTWHPTTQ